jgi:hypothetical protein
MSHQDSPGPDQNPPPMTDAETADIRKELDHLLRFYETWAACGRERGSAFELCGRVIPRLLAEIERLKMEAMRVDQMNRCTPEVSRRENAN